MSSLFHNQRWIRRWCPELLLLCIYCILLFWQIGYYYLWGDEAETAIFARAVLHTGLPSGFDGRNFFEFYGGILHNCDLINVRSPWLQYYLTAASMALFGQETWAVRVPFAVCGLTAAWFTYLFARDRHGRRVALITLLLFVSNVPLLLFMRQCRYYALTTLLMAVATWLYNGYSLARRGVLLAFAGIFVCFFFAHPVVGFSCLAGLFAGAFIENRRNAIRMVLLPSGIAVPIIASYLAWVHFSNPPPDDMMFRNLAPGYLFRGIWMFVRDSNTLGLLPIGILLLVSAMWVRQNQHAINREEPKTLLLDPMIFVAVLVAVVVSSALALHPHDGFVSDIRYIVPLFPLMILLQALAHARILRVWPRIGRVTLTLACTTNLLSLSETPRSLIFEHVRENANPTPNPVRRAVTELNRLTTQDDLVLVTPNFMTSSMIYYLGHKLRFCRTIGHQNEAFLRCEPQRLPVYVYSPDTMPHYIVRFGISYGLREEFLSQFTQTLPLSEYSLVYEHPNGEDKSRAEIWWRTFTPWKTDAMGQSPLTIQRHLSAGGGV